MPQPIDALSGAPYVLEGRIVTMGPAGIIPDGAIFIADGQIKGVHPKGDGQTPDGFSGAPRVRTGDTIYPGFIELHNHLSYNAIPLWDVPQRFTNNGQWRNHDDYRRLITKPSQVLGRSPGIVEALIRFVECRALLGGTTTSQGITLSSAPGIQQFYKGLVRNVEQTDDDALPEAGTKIANPSTGEAAAYLQNLQNQTCYLQHLSEGVDDTARGWFLRLQLDDGEWAITDALSGIHSTALSPDDLNILAARNGSVVWSPLSNYLLYGGTLNLHAAKEAQVLMGIGCDWAPSGSKNLLGELKVAWLANLQAGEAFTAEEIVAMATINPAKILKWDKVLGSIETGKRADLVAINGQQGDDYIRVIEARETSVTLVVIDGVPRAGQNRIMKRFKGSTEKISVGRSARLLNLHDESSHPLVQGLTLGEATDRLEDALENLPVLAQAIDAQTADTGLFGGSTDATGTTWRIVMEVDEEEVEDELAFAAQSLADFVSPMALEPITVADDAQFLRRMVAARNLPEFVKTGLPPLYGEFIPLPDSASFLEDEAVELPPQVLSTTRELNEFLRTWGELSTDDLHLILDQAELLLEQHYVHLPLKRAMHAVDPIQRLRLLRARLQEEGSGERPEMDFHNELASIFNSLRDLHTLYELPAPFRTKTAWLPFLVEEFWEYGRRRYLVSKVVGSPGPESFVPGVELTHWNGMPIERAIALNATRYAGSNEPARHARGLNSLTLRPLVHGLPPDEEWVTLRYLDDQGRAHEWTQPWLVFEPGRGSNSLDPNDAVLQVVAIGVDAQTDDVQEAKKVLFAGKIVQREERALERGTEFAPMHNTRRGLATFLPTVFRAKEVKTGFGTFGYIRIFTFNVANAEGFVQEFVRLAEALPDSGLIVDVRGNGGGLIHAAERLLQVLTPRQIIPERAQFLNTPVNLSLCRRHAPSSVFEGFTLAHWIPSIAESVKTGATYSLGFPITEEADCNDIGQRYFGPVVLITDALCYSATDMFAAGFQDHRIGKVLGIHANTGAGGANVWSHYLLRRLMVDSDGMSAYTPLPGGANLRVAMRRTVRVGENAGGILEDLGVQPDAIHKMTRRDVMEANADLIAAAAKLLSSQKSHPLEVKLTPKRGPVKRAAVRTSHVQRLDVLVNDRPRGSYDVKRARVVIDLDELTGGTDELPRTLELRGYEENELAVRYRVELPRG